MMLSKKLDISHFKMFHFFKKWNICNFQPHLQLFGLPLKKRKPLFIEYIESKKALPL